MQNIYAYTANTNPHPEYVSLNKMPDGKISLAVRAPACPGQFSNSDEGPYAGIELPRSELLKLCEALKAELTPPMMKARGESI